MVWHVLEIKFEFWSCSRCLSLSLSGKTNFRLVACARTYEYHVYTHSLHSLTHSHVLVRSIASYTWFTVCYLIAVVANFGRKKASVLAGWLVVWLVVGGNNESILGFSVFHFIIKFVKLLVI